MEERLRRFRDRASQEHGDRSKSQTRYSEELQREAVECVREGVERGLSKRAISAGLGVSEPTLRQWLRSRTGALRPVEILGGEVGGGMVEPQPRRVVVSPRGLRVEGLELEEIATLLRVLG